MIPTTQQVIPLTPEKLTYWREAIKKARQKRSEVATKDGWDDNLKRVQPAQGADINIGVDFADVERKKAALLFDTPFVALTEPAQGLEQAVVIHQELLNTLLGPEHADVQPVALRAIFNCLCPAGIGPVLVGYHCTKQNIEQNIIVIDPATKLPVLDPLTQEPQTQKVTVPVPIHEKFFATDLSPKALLLPAELRTTAYQKSAQWMGYEWQKPLSQVRRELGKPAGWTPQGGRSESEKPYFEHGEDHQDAAGDPPISGVTLWYVAALDAKPGQAVHPERLRKLTLLDGSDEPVEHLDSPDQTLAEDGRLTPDSLIGFNIRPLVLRDLSDSAWIPSDCAITANLTKEQQRYREIALRKRDTNVNVIGYDVERLPTEALAKAKKEAGTGNTIWLPLPTGSLVNGGSDTAAQLAQAVQNRETYLDQDLIARDRARVLGMENNQVGASDKKTKTATETSLIQRNTDARFEQERQRVLKWYLYDLVKSFDALVLRYCDERLATEILGQQKAAIWLQAKPALAGGYRYTLQMDSGKYLDVEADRRQMLQIINFAAKSPYVNQQTLWAKFAEKFGFDPTTFLVQPEPQKPEPPKLSITAKAEDFVLPQGAILLEIMHALGYPIPAQAVQNALAMQQQMVQQGMLQQAETGKPLPPGHAQGTPQHGGGADKAERIDQHNLDETGALPGPGPS
jgi:hypothetical protein